ncbi:MAG TPA: cytochrome P450 [Acidimicrobiales bacterium]|nr:cytochrome P450 [Acidimicrobiales bacterium]
MTTQGRIAPYDDATYDPFKEFDRTAGAAKVGNPYPDFAELRRGGPVHKRDLRELYDLEGMDGLGDLPDAYTVVTHEAVEKVLRDGQTFSSSGYAESMGMVMGHSILEMDEPEHRAYRGLVQQAFTRKAMVRWESDLVRPIVNGFIDSFAGRGRADLVADLTFPFPVRVIAGMLGLPEEDLDTFHAWAVGLTNVGADFEHGMEASGKLRDYFAGILAERRRQPSEDVITALAQAELEGKKLTDEDIFAFLRLLLPAGAETTYRSSSNLLTGLLANPDQLEALRADRSLMPQAIEEALRWEPPLTAIARTTTREVDISGVTVPAGVIINVNMGAANHDPARYPDPERFDIFRDPQQHMSFAYGPHMCLGMHLARMETTVAIGSLLDRLPGLRLDPDAPPPEIRGLAFRAPKELRVVFD